MSLQDLSEGKVSRSEILEWLYDTPLEYAHSLGYTKLTDLHNEWLRDMIFGQDEYSLAAHRGSMKTSCGGIATGVRMIIAPKKSRRIFRKTDDNVEEIVSAITRDLSSPQAFALSKMYWGKGIEIRANKTSIDTNYHIAMSGAKALGGHGFKTAITGKHCEEIWTDDITNPDDRTSAAERRRTNNNYMELKNILNPGGRMMNTCTIWHKEDASSLMKNLKKVDCHTSGLMTPKQIQEKRLEMTNALFAANYELKFINDDLSLFPNPQMITDETLCEGGISHVDAGYGGDDSTALTIINYIDGEFYVYGKIWKDSVINHMEEIAYLHKKFKCGTLYLENNADKGFLEKEFKKILPSVKGYHEKTNKFIKISENILKYWRQKHIFFLDITDPAYLDNVIEYNELAEHDDAPDSLASGIRVYNKRFKLEWFM